MVSTVEKYGHTGGEHAYAGVDIGFEDVRLRIDAVRHVAVEQNKVNLLEVDVFAKGFHKVGPFVYVVKHKESEVAWLGGESAKFVRLSTPNVGGRYFAKGNPVVVFPLRNGLGKDAITIVRVGLQSVDTHAMHAVCQFASPV